MHDSVEPSRHIDIIRHVMMNELEPPLSGKMRYVIDRSSNQVIHRDHLVTVRQQAVTQM